MMMFYEALYRKYGVRKVGQLISPPLPALENLALPKNAILHYVTTSPIEGAPASDDFLFRSITRPIQVEHVIENGDSKGMPRRLAITVDPLIRQFHIKNRRFLRMRSLEAATRDPNILLVVNYGFIPRLYRYMRSYYSEYYRWWNIQAAMWKHIAELTQKTDRQHFICVNLPKILPSMSDLKLGEGALSQKTMKIFQTPESMMVLELWKWFGENRKESVLANLPDNKFDQVNLIFQESGRWFMLNLGLINNWRKPVAGEPGADDPKRDGYAASQMQRRFLRLAMALFQVRSNGAAEVDNAIRNTETVAPKTGTEQPEPVVAATIIPAAIPTKDPATGVVGVKSETLVIQDDENDPHAQGPDSRAEDIKPDNEVEKQIEADLAELETISKNALALVDDTEQTPVVEEVSTLEQGVMKVCDRLADIGLLSAAEYRRYNTLANTYRTLKAPDGKVTLEEFIQVKPEDIQIPESPAIKDVATVTDKTMLKSSLMVFDQHYIKHVMQKDVAGMVMNIQHAGVAVTDYQVEHIDDVMGSFKAYTVRVTPVDGASSTLRFKLPVMEDDGTYTANGVKYRMRKQRGDLPIRKIGPGRVALTSYYGKVFVSRSTKRVNDYGQWLRNQIMAKGLDDADPVVTNLRPADVFDNGMQCPRLYSILAMGFRGFTLSPVAGDRTNGRLTFDLSFDFSKRLALYGQEALDTYEKEGAIIVGISNNGQYLVLDQAGTFYLATGGTLHGYGTIESLLQLDSEKAPVEFAELKVMGRDIPMGLVLGYELGLERLMKLLKVEPRRVSAGSRTNMAFDEFGLAFSDETLVFSKDDKLAAMILGGFNEYHRAIREYSVTEFDRRAVYLNVLESNGASVRYLREIDLMYQMFIDPITRDLLVEMKEPTNFHGLLMRSCELLLTDQHPDELDPAHMRIKGYERMAGAVYSEIVKSIRSHNGRSGKSKHPIDLNPYAVWKNISEDPSKAQVSDINPIQNLKEVEAVTYNGTGGRGSRSMTKRTRAYHENDMGTISESTVDSSDVAINTYTSADPQFTSLRGISRRYKLKETGPTALLSTSALISPGSDRDD